MKSTCKKLWCLSVYKKSTLTLTSFLRYCNNIVNSLFWKLWECLIIPIKIIVSLCRKLSCLSSSQTSLFQRKTNDKTSKKAILGTFSPNLNKNEFSWKKGLCRFLNIQIIYQYGKNQKKLTKEKCHMDKQTHKQLSFYRAPLYDGGVIFEMVWVA